MENASGDPDPPAASARGRDVRLHGRAAAGARRLARHLLPVHPERRGGQAPGQRRERRHRPGQGGHECVRRTEGRKLGAAGRLGQITQPTPAGPLLPFGNEHLVETLRPAFVAHQGSLGLGERTGRQRHRGAPRWCHGWSDRPPPPAPTPAWRPPQPAAPGDRGRSRAPRPYPRFRPPPSGRLPTYSRRSAARDRNCCTPRP